MTTNPEKGLHKKKTTTCESGPRSRTRGTVAPPKRCRAAIVETPHWGVSLPMEVVQDTADKIQSCVRPYYFFGGLPGEGLKTMVSESRKS
jgi:hypothetical protein